MAETVEHVSAGLLGSEVKSEHCLMNRGVSCMARMGGKTTGYSVLAMKKTVSLFTGISRKTVHSVSHTGSAVRLLLTPTAELIASKINIGNHARLRRGIRRLRKEISLLQKRMGPLLAQGLSSGAVNLAEDPDIQQQVNAIRHKEKEIELLVGSLKAQEGRKIQVVEKGRRKEERSTEAETLLPPERPAVDSELPERRRGTESEVSARGDEEVLIGQPAAKPPLEIEQGGKPHTRIEPSPVTQKTAPARQVKKFAGLKKGGARSEPPTPAEDTQELSLAEIVRQTKFSMASEQLIFQGAVRDVQSEDPAVRESALGRLKKIKNPAATLVFVRLASDPSEAVRARCLDSLLERKDESALPAFEAAVEDSSAHLRIKALRGLYRLNRSGATPFFLKALNDPGAGVRRRAVTCLNWAGVQEAEPDLISMLDDSDRAVRKAAIGALEKLKSTLAVSRLIEVLEDEDPVIRECAYGALKNLTKQGIDFKPGASPEVRARGKARWDSWWQRKKSSFHVI